MQHITVLLKSNILKNTTFFKSRCINIFFINKSFTYLLNIIFILNIKCTVKTPSSDFKRNAFCKQSTQKLHFCALSSKNAGTSMYPKSAQVLGRALNIIFLDNEAILNFKNTWIY